MPTTNACNIVQNPSNSMTQYDEGTFTPTISGSTVAGAGTYTTQLGFYQRIGNGVFFSGTVVWTAHTGTGNMLLTGLPFTSKTTAGYSAPMTVQMESITYPAATVDTFGYILSNVTQVSLLATRSNNTALPIAMDATGTIAFSGFYLTQ